MDIKKLVMKEEVPSIQTPEELAEKIASFLLDKKAKDIKIINLKGKTIVSDYFVVCSATSSMVMPRKSAIFCAIRGIYELSLR